MTRQELIALCLQYADAYEDYPFDDRTTTDLSECWTVMRHRGNKKSFAFLFERGGELCVNLKCDVLTAEFLRAQYAGITPAYHMNKLHWNTVRPNADVPEELLEGMVEDSWRLTAPKERKRQNKSEKS